MRTNEPKTPLLALLRLLTAEQREQLAKDAGTRVDYLYALGSCTRKSCKAALAARIEAATRKMALVTTITPVITVAELGAMCDCVDL
jgi:hypothetical protein